jgi:hypothetical protein
MTDEKHVLKATAATLLVSKLVHRLLDLVSIVGMFVAFLGAVARAGYDAGMWWKTAHTSGYTNAELLYDVGIANQQTGLLGLQQILDEALDWPAWIGLLIAGVILLAINAMAKAKLRDIEQRLAWKKVWPVELAPSSSSQRNKATSQPRDQPSRPLPLARRRDEQAPAARAPRAAMPPVRREA